MVTFDTFMATETETPSREPSTQNLLRQLIGEQLIKAKLVPASRSNQLTDAAEAARFLSDSVIDMHRMIVQDGSTNWNERRQSYQAVCLHFIMLMSMAGGIEPPQE
jgi:hypothetical protein